MFNILVSRLKSRLEEKANFTILSTSLILVNFVPNEVACRKALGLSSQLFSGAFRPPEGKKGARVII